MLSVQCIISPTGNRAAAAFSLPADTMALDLRAGPRRAESVGGTIMTGRIDCD